MLENQGELLLAREATIIENWSQMKLYQIEDESINN
jgi:hypothetical protein